MEEEKKNCDQQSVFKTLSEVAVQNKVRQKGNFWYVSWSNAVRELLKRYPGATWKFTEFNGLPFLQTDVGYFVECTVSVDGIDRTQMMPVLDFRNKVEMSPDAAQINKAQMRALTKAIALHGFGLELWAGEDLDQEEEQSSEYSAFYSDDQFNQSYPLWEQQILSGQKTADQILGFLAKKGVNLSLQQISIVQQVGRI